MPSGKDVHSDMFKSPESTMLQDHFFPKGKAASPSHNIQQPQPAILLETVENVLRVEFIRRPHMQNKEWLEFVINRIRIEVAKLQVGA